MIQGSSFLNTPLQAATVKPTATPTPVLDDSLLANALALAPAQSQVSGESILSAMGNGNILSTLLPLIAYLLQALIALSASNAQDANPFSGQVDANAVPAPTPTPVPAPAPAPENKEEDKQAVKQEKADNTPEAKETKPEDKETKSDDIPVQDVTNNPPATQPPNSVNVKDFGAVGDGKVDDQAALQKAVDQAKATGQSVWIPPGTYNHSGVLTIDGTQVNGAGKDTVLNATNPDQEAVKLTGDSPSLSNVKTTVSAPNRSSMPDAAAVLVQNASNATVTHVITQGAASNGIRLDNATGSHIANNLVLGSNADGIALMNGSSNNLVKGNVVYQAGDDSYSDDSYRGDARQDEGNTFDGNLSLDNAYGRGITLAGSKNAVVKNNIVSGSRWIGIWGDSDPNSGTMDSIGHTIQNNVVINNPNGAPVQANGAGTTVSGTVTEVSIPSLVSILGWDPGQLPDRKGFNNLYTPGTGSGANNSGGVRT